MVVAVLPVTRLRSPAGSGQPTWYLVRPDRQLIYQGECRIAAMGGVPLRAVLPCTKKLCFCAGRVCFAAEGDSVLLGVVVATEAVATTAAAIMVLALLQVLLLLRLSLSAAASAVAFWCCCSYHTTAVVLWPV